MGDYITFKTFYTNTEAAELVALLYEKGVASRIQKSVSAWRVGALPEFAVQIDESDLIKVNNIIENFEIPGLRQ